MSKIYEFKSREGSLAPTPKNEKKEDLAENKRSLLELLDPISQKLFKEGLEAVYGDLDSDGSEIDEEKLKEEKAQVELMSDDEIVEELADQKNQELIASDPELFQAYRERIMGKNGIV